MAYKLVQETSNPVTVTMLNIVETSISLNRSFEEAEEMLDNICTVQDLKDDLEPITDGKEIAALGAVIEHFVTKLHASVQVPTYESYMGNKSQLALKYTKEGVGSALKAGWDWLIELIKTIVEKIGNFFKSVWAWLFGKDSSSISSSSTEVKKAEVAVQQVIKENVSKPSAAKPAEVIKTVEQISKAGTEPPVNGKPKIDIAELQKRLEETKKGEEDAAKAVAEVEAAHKQSYLSGFQKAINNNNELFADFYSSNAPIDENGNPLYKKIGVSQLSEMYKSIEELMDKTKLFGHNYLVELGKNTTTALIESDLFKAFKSDVNQDVTTKDEYEKLIDQIASKFFMELDIFVGFKVNKKMKSRPLENGSKIPSVESTYVEPKIPYVAVLDHDSFSADNYSHVETQREKLRSKIGVSLKDLNGVSDKMQADADAILTKFKDELPNRRYKQVIEFSTYVVQGAIRNILKVMQNILQAFHNLMDFDKRITGHGVALRNLHISLEEAKKS